MTLKTIAEQRFAPEWDSQDTSGLDAERARDQGIDKERERDPETGAALGILGGTVVGAIAGGPVGAIVGSIAAGFVSGLGVAAVDHHDREVAKQDLKNTNADTVADVEPPMTVHPASQDRPSQEAKVLVNGANAVVAFDLSGFDHAGAVSVAGTFNDWSPWHDHLTRAGDRWTIALALPPGTYAYKFVVDGIWMVDPVNREVVVDADGRVNSVLYVRS